MILCDIQDMYLSLANKLIRNRINGESGPLYYLSFYAKHEFFP